jgi:outer membrane protein assembly factor BamB
MYKSTVYILLLNLLILTALSTAEDWPRWRGPSANGVSAEKNWNPKALDNPNKLWEMNLGVGHSSVAIKGKYLYTMGNIDSEDIVYCLDALTGEEYWRFSYECSPGSYAGPRGTPTIDGDYVYTMSRDGQVHCLEAMSGKLVWKKNVEDEFDAESPRWGFATSPYILDDMLLLNACEHGIALNKKTGEKIWASDSEESGYATPTVISLNGKTYGLFFGAKNLYGVDLNSGNAIWSHPWRTDYDVNASDPLVIGDKVFITSGYESGGALLDLKNNSPEVVWRNGNMSNHFGGAVYYDGHLYGSSGFVGKSRTKLHCVNVESGELVWSEKLGFNSLILADKKLVILTEKGKLIISDASPEGLKEISSAQVLPRSIRCWTAPILSYGRIYCRNTDGDIVCIDVSK